MNVPDRTVTITHEGNTLKMDYFTGPLNPDGSFSMSNRGGQTYQGVVATEGGHTVMRGVLHNGPCEDSFEATKQ